MPDELSHLDEQGRARMVDVAAKPSTARRAVAEGFVRLEAATLEAIEAGRVGKGEVLAVARVAGVQAAKRTADWIPLCHPLRLDAVAVAFDVAGDGRLRVQAEVRATDRTGVEMEALVAVSAAALTVYDMVKAIDRRAAIEDVRLLAKEGGKSGPWRREDAEDGS